MSEHALAVYLGSILLLTCCFVYSLVGRASQSDVSGWWLMALGIVVAIFGSQVAISLINLMVTLWVKPRPLPRMDFSKGIPAEWRTIVVVPAIIGSANDIETLIEALEVRFLGNRDPHLQFALLTDFNDAQSEHMPEDAALLDLATARIQELNKRYQKDDSDIFYLFHRPRQWNASEKAWMGRERKRGKLSDFNDLLINHNQTNFSLIVGNQSILSSVKYVITLDADTQLPRESAQQYVSTMAHPLNHPRLNLEKNYVVDGYCILQPRVAEALTNSRPTTLCQSLWK